MHYPETIRPALEVIGAHPKAGLVSGMYMLVFEKHVVFCADTTVNIDPTAEQLAQIAYSAAAASHGTFGIEPRIAMLSFSNFGSVRHPEAEKVARAVQLLRQRDPSLIVDGEMQADTALDTEILQRDYPFSALKAQANVLIFPNLSAGNIAYKLLDHLGGATAIGPILVGMSRPVHVLERGADVQDIVNMAAVAVVDAQGRTQPAEPAAARNTPVNGIAPDSLLEVMSAYGNTDATAARSSRTAGQRLDWKHRGSSLDGEVHWNLVAAVLIQNAARRSEGDFAEMGPFVAVTSPHTGRSPNDKFVVREPQSERDVDWGKVNQPFIAGEVRDAACGRARLSERAATSCSFRISIAVPTRSTGCRSATCRRARGTWRSCETCSSAPTSPSSRRSIRTSRCCTRRSSRPIRHKHGTRTQHLHRAEPRQAHDSHRRHALRRRVEEGDVHRDELLPAEAGRALDALLGERRQGRRHRAVLRPVGNRKDDAVRRSGAIADRRRRARVVERRASSISRAAATPR